MSNTYRILFKFTLSLAVDLFVVNTFFSLPLIQQLILIIAVFIFFTILEYLGYFSFFEEKLKFFFINTKKFIPLNKAIAQIINQLDINKLWKDYRFDDHTIYPHLQYKKCGRIESIELLTIFTLIREEKLILYAHKIIDSGHNYIDTSHLPLQRISKDFFSTCDIYNKDTWMDNYNIIRNPYDGGEYYVNISIKSTELDNFIKEHKLTS